MNPKLGKMKRKHEDLFWKDLDMFSASMIWIIGEYAERIDNADELLEGFLEGFKDENSQVQLQLLTAIVKLFLKKPTETPQDLVTRVLTLVTQVSNCFRIGMREFYFIFQETDNPDLRDRGYIYWRLLSTDPKAAKEVVLAEKPLISEETDLLEPTLLDELICHIGTLASVYHKPPNAFVEGRYGLKKNLPFRSGMDDDETPDPDIMSNNHQQQTVVISGNVGSLIDDFDILGPMPTAPHTTATMMAQTQPRASSAVPNLLDDDLSSILEIDSHAGGHQTPQSHMSMQNTMPATTTTTSLPVNQPAKSGNLLDDLFGDLNLGGGNTSLSYSSSNTFALPKEVN